MVHLNIFLKFRLNFENQLANPNWNLILFCHSCRWVCQITNLNLILFCHSWKTHFSTKTTKNIFSLKPQNTVLAKIVLVKMNFLTKADFSVKITKMHFHIKTRFFPQKLQNTFFHQNRKNAFSFQNRKNTFFRQNRKNSDSYKNLFSRQNRKMYFPTKP